MFVQRARDNLCFVAFCNAVGGQDELIFDGHSLVLDDEGEVLARAPGFEEALLVCDVDPHAVVGRRLRDVRRRALAREREELPARMVEVSSSPRPAPPVEPVIVPIPDDLEQMRRALELGLLDYVEKNGFREVVLGVSGGIDSALTAALAAEALGPERVHCVSMPSRYSSEGTRSDARRLAEDLGCDFRELPIGPVVDAYSEVLAGPFEGLEHDLTEENLQARARGVMLMALSNKFGWLVVATGNKSELSVGYATLYGDMAGGFALLKDVYKTDVFRLSRYLNEHAGRELIPQSIIERAPSAELRDDQLTRTRCRPTRSSTRCWRPTWRRTARARSSRRMGSTRASSSARRVIDRAEYKRRQAPPGVKLRPKAFGRDRRTPITNRWRD